MNITSGVLPSPEWTRRALCAEVDPDIFFPEVGDDVEKVKRICKTCDVREECLKYSLDNDERFGIWGGLSEINRRKLRAERKLG